MARAVDGRPRAPSALGYLARHEARRRLGSLLAIALLIAFVGGVAMTALAGARRTGSTYVFGIPIGILIGTTGWLIVARRLRIADEVPLSWIAIVCTALATLLVANVIAAFPANRAARTSPASALRAE